MTTLLTLPCELRDQIIYYALDPSGPVLVPDSPPPSITQVCRALRAEALPLWLALPTSSYPCTTRTDLTASKRHLANLPAELVAGLRVLHLSATATVPFGHMAMRRSLTLTLFLSHDKLGSLSWNLSESLPSVPLVPTYGLGCRVAWGGIVGPSKGVESAWLIKRREGLEKRLKWVVLAMEGRVWDAEALGEIMEGFWGVCAGGR